MVNLLPTACQPDHYSFTEYAIQSRISRVQEVEYSLCFQLLANRIVKSKRLNILCFQLLADRIVKDTILKMAAGQELPSPVSMLMNSVHGRIYYSQQITEQEQKAE